MENKSGYIEVLELARKRLEDILQKTPLELKAIQSEIEYLKRRETEKTLPNLPLLAWDVIRKQLETSEETLFYLCMASPLIHQIISMKRGKSSHQTLRFTGDKVIGILTQNLYLDKADLENLSKTKTQLANCAPPNFPFVSHAKGSTVKVRDTARQTLKQELVSPGGVERYLNFLRTKVGSESQFLLATTCIIKPKWSNSDDDDEGRIRYWNTIDSFMEQFGKHLTYIELTIPETQVAYQLIERLAWRNFSLLPRLQSLIIVANGVRNEVVAEIDERTRSTSFRLISDHSCPQQNKLLQVLLPEVTRWLITLTVEFNKHAEFSNHKTTARWKLKEITLISHNDASLTQFINYFAASGILEKIEALRVIDRLMRLTTFNFSAAFTSVRELEINNQAKYYTLAASPNEPISETISSEGLKLPSVLKLTIIPQRDFPLDVISKMFPNLQILFLKFFYTGREELKSEESPLIFEKVDVFRLYKHDQSLCISNVWDIFSKLRVLSVKTRHDYVRNDDDRYLKRSTETYTRSPNGIIGLKKTTERGEEVRKYEDSDEYSFQY